MRPHIDVTHKVKQPKPIFSVAQSVDVLMQLDSMPLRSSATSNSASAQKTSKKCYSPTIGNRTTFGDPSKLSNAMLWRCWIHVQPRAINSFRPASIEEMDTSFRWTGCNPGSSLESQMRNSVTNGSICMNSTLTKSWRSRFMTVIQRRSQMGRRILLSTYQGRRTRRRG